MPNKAAALGIFLTLLSFGAEDAPPWLRDLAAVNLPAYGPKVNTVVLFDEEHVTVGESGKLTTTTRTAIKILSRQGADLRFFEEYDTRTSKVHDFKAWMIAPSGKIKKYGKEEIVDVACAENDVYNECRRKVVSGKRDAEAGAVFAYESTVERQSFSNQEEFHFQDSSPVRLARFVVTTPAGWQIKSTSFNGAPSAKGPDGGTYMWQMEDLPPLEREIAAPSVLTLAPWVGVNLLGPAGKNQALEWTAAAKLLTELNDGQAEPSPAMIAKAKELTMGATTEIDKIRALGQFAQQVNYVSIQVNLSRGGGYKPHAAPEVFTKLYGDCKDKANLMRGLLKAVGITAYPVAIYSGDRTHVSPEWVSLGAFNHAISAIRVGPETIAPAVLEDPKMGRLLFFDPTDPYVPVGYLPDHEQASMALVGAGDVGNLVKVPVGLVKAAGLLREVDAALKSDGAIDGTFVETRTGEALPESISEYRANSKTEYSKMVERWVGQSVPGSTTTDIEVKDSGAEFVLKAKFAAPRFAKTPQSRMMIFRCSVLRHNQLRLTEKIRKYPVVVDAEALQETARISLPADFKVDELPDRVHVESPFGKFDANWEVDAGVLVFKRTIEMPAQTIPAAQYADLKKFLDTMAGSGEMPVVLVK
jgi:hypothetical protein